MKPRVFLFALLLGGHAVGSANERLLHQPARFPGDFQTTPSYVTESSSGFRGFDDFRLLGGGEITNVRWQGFLSDGSTSPSPDTGGWVVSFSQDANGSAGDLLYETTIDAPALSTSLRDTMTTVPGAPATEMPTATSRLEIWSWRSKTVATRMDLALP